MAEASGREPRLPPRYRVVRRLGSGGFGSVFLAQDLQLGRAVAVKVLGEAVADRVGRERFFREAVLTSRVSHPHVVKVFEAGATEDGAAFLVYEYVPGLDLVSIRSDSRRRTPGAVRRYGIQLAEALAAVHAAGILHRDLKPRNVLVRESGDAVLCDFGIAFDPTAPMLTQAGMLVGTPVYMAPELFRGAPPSPATDQFGLAATLFELLHGKTVYGVEGLEGILRVAASGVPLGVVDPATASPLDVVLRQALDPDPAHRFPGLEAMGRAIAAIPVPETPDPEVPVAGPSRPTLVVADGAGADRVGGSSGAVTPKAIGLAAPVVSRGRIAGGVAAGLAIALVAGLASGPGPGGTGAGPLDAGTGGTAAPARPGTGEQIGASVDPEVERSLVRLAGLTADLDHYEAPAPGGVELDRDPEGLARHLRREANRIFGEDIQFEWQRGLGLLTEVLTTSSGPPPTALDPRLSAFLRAYQHHLSELYMAVTRPETVAAIDDSGSAALRLIVVHRILKRHEAWIAENLELLGIPGGAGSLALARADADLAVYSTEVQLGPRVDWFLMHLDRWSGADLELAIDTTSLLNAEAVRRREGDCAPVGGRLDRTMTALAAALDRSRGRVYPSRVFAAFLIPAIEYARTCGTIDWGLAERTWIPLLERIAREGEATEVREALSGVAKLFENHRDRNGGEPPPGIAGRLARLADLAEARPREPGQDQAQGR